MGGAIPCWVKSVMPGGVGEGVGDGLLAAAVFSAVGEGPFIVALEVGEGVSETLPVGLPVVVAAGAGLGVNTLGPEMLAQPAVASRLLKITTHRRRLILIAVGQVYPSIFAVSPGLHRWRVH